MAYKSSQNGFVSNESKFRKWGAYAAVSLAFVAFASLAVLFPSWENVILGLVLVAVTPVSVALYYLVLVALGEDWNELKQDFKF